MTRLALTLAAASLAVTALAGCNASDSRESRGGVSNVVLVTVDTLRADHLSPYGYDRETSPAIAALAREGTLFEQAFAQIPETLPSIVSIMTSQYPIDHGVRENGFTLRDAPRTLAEVLRDEDFLTAAFISSAVLASASGLSRGFDVYNERFPDKFLELREGQRTGDKTVAAARHWLQHYSGDKRRFFLWVHLNDPHSLYTPPAPYDVRFLDEPYEGLVSWKPRQFFRIIRNQLAIDAKDVRYMIASYDGEIAFMDDAVGALLRAIDEFAQGDTLVVFTADHGESLGEHGYFFDHGDYLYDDQTRVPLIVRHPGLPSARSVSELVESVDIMPTVLELAGLPQDGPRRGRSLVPLLRGEPGPDAGTRLAFSESDSCSEISVRPCRVDGVAGKLYAVRSSEWKLVRDPHGPNELFDLVSDPGEERDVSAMHADVAGRLSEELDLLLEGASTHEQELDAETAERLRALGYVD